MIELARSRAADLRTTAEFATGVVGLGLGVVDESDGVASFASPNAHYCLPSWPSGAV